MIIPTTIICNMDYLNPKMDIRDVNAISMLGLPHVGDGVYELLVRAMLCEQGHRQVNELHHLTVGYVKAPAQAGAVQKILNALAPEELEVYKRGRNAHVNSIPQHANVGEYHAATGLEALFGWLYLLGRRERVSELFAMIVED